MRGLLGLYSGRCELTPGLGPPAGGRGASSSCASSSSTLDTLPCSSSSSSRAGLAAVQQGAAQIRTASPIGVPLRVLNAIVQRSCLAEGVPRQAHARSAHMGSALWMEPPWCSWRHTAGGPPRRGAVGGGPHQSPPAPPHPPHPPVCLLQHLRAMKLPPCLHSCAAEHLGM